MNVLVMWSGGIDSTYTLAKLLKDTDHTIHAHHMSILYSHLHGEAPRGQLEVNAINALVPKLKTIRPFTVTQTMVDQRPYGKIPPDMFNVCVEAGKCSREFQLNPALSPFDFWTIGTHLKEGHWQTRFEQISKATHAACWPYDAPQFVLQPMVSKAQEMEYLKELGMLDDCWYCRTPKDKKPCGTCKTCIEVNGKPAQTKSDALPSGIVL